MVYKGEIEWKSKWRRLIWTELFFMMICRFPIFQGYYTESRTQRDTHRAGNGAYVWRGASQGGRIGTFWYTFDLLYRRMDHDEPFRETDMAGWDRYFRGRKDSSDSKRKGWLVHTFLMTRSICQSPIKRKQSIRSTEPRLWHTWEMHFTIRRKSRRGWFCGWVRSGPQRDTQGHRDEFSDEVEVVFPGDDFVDVHKKESAKGQRFKSCAICGIFLFLRSSLLVIQKWCIYAENGGNFLCCKNADEYARSAAGNICDSNENDGVAKVLAEYLV